MTVVKCILFYSTLLHFSFVGYVPLPKTKLDFTELDAKPTKKVCICVQYNLEVMLMCISV